VTWKKCHLSTLQRKRKIIRLHNSNFKTYSNFKTWASDTIKRAKVVNLSAQVEKVLETNYHYCPQFLTILQDLYLPTYSL
jgi:hypothetical protein